MIDVPAGTKLSSGVSCSEQEDSYGAGVEIATRATRGVALGPHTLFLMFCSPGHNTAALLEGMRSVIGPAPQIMGCTTAGLMASDFLSYRGLMAGAAYISSEEPFFSLFTEQIGGEEFNAGMRLAQQLMAAGTAEDASLLLFYDSVKVTSTDGQPALNLATPILEGFHAAYKSWPRVAGIGALGDPNFTHPCSTWSNQELGRHTLVAATIAGRIRMDTMIMHGTKPVSGYHTITKAKDNVILEIDGKPALDVIDGLLGSSISWEDFPFFLTLGINNGVLFGEYNEEDYASRLCLAIDREHKALIMFETDIVEGTQVQLMRGNIDFGYIGQQVEKVLQKIGDRKPVLAFYIDCLGRAAAFSGYDEEEAAEVRRALGDVPFFGIYSGVEIANVGQSVRALDWTGVLCLFSEA